MKILVLLSAFLLLGVVGCAGIPLSHDQCNATKFSTAMEHEACLKGAEDWVQEQYAREDRRIQKRDKLIAFLNACDRADGLVILETIRSGRSKLPRDGERRKAMKELGYKFTHDNVDRHARKHDFQCVEPKSIFEALRNQGF